MADLQCAQMLEQECHVVKRIENKVDDALEKLNDLNRRLYVGNGQPAVMTRLDRIERVVSVLIWAGGIIGGTLLVGIVGLAIKVGLMVNGVLS